MSNYLEPDNSVLQSSLRIVKVWSAIETSVKQRNKIENYEMKYPKILYKNIQICNAYMWLIEI